MFYLLQKKACHQAETFWNSPEKAESSQWQEKGRQYYCHNCKQSNGWPVKIALPKRQSEILKGGIGSFGQALMKHGMANSSPHIALFN
jgi:hypothetical protein